MKWGWVQGYMWSENKRNEWVWTRKKYMKHLLYESEERGEARSLGHRMCSLTNDAHVSGRACELASLILECLAGHTLTRSRWYEMSSSSISYLLPISNWLRKAAGCCPLFQPPPPVSPHLCSYPRRGCSRAWVLLNALHFSCFCDVQHPKWGLSVYHRGAYTTVWDFSRVHLKFIVFLLLFFLLSPPPLYSLSNFIMLLKSMCPPAHLLPWFI